ncbi:hypothetical protein [Salipiger sp. PrR003]|uniref:hypothetical protein n=1 Tax=Salipiger sp. PrR003 TaxID=2706776 RepID=UPI0013DA2A0D|nr:hypothetical protein [Salipiger sp. PrR003]NDV52108.1 hypothetical protein [Salipiger sp. PrR003]
MSITAGHQALIRRVVTMTDPPNIVLPNGEGKGLPRYVVQAAGGAQTPADMTGKTRAFPEIVVRVETKAWPAGQYFIESDALVAALVARFPPGAKFDGVKIDRAPDVRPSLPVTDGVLSIPVVIRATFIF